MDSIRRISALPGRRRRSALGIRKIPSREGEDRGQNKNWEAEITNQVPDQEISWESVDGSSNSGTITFEELDPQWTRVTASIGYEPEGILEKTEEVLGITSGRVERDLEQFRDYIQGKAKGSGGWRRRVANENTVETDVLPMG